MRKTVSLLFDVACHRSMDCNCAQDIDTCSFNTRRHFHLASPDVSGHSSSSLFSTLTRCLAFDDDILVSEEGEIVDISLPRTELHPSFWIYSLNLVQAPADPVSLYCLDTFLKSLIVLIKSCYYLLAFYFHLLVVLRHNFLLQLLPIS